MRKANAVLFSLFLSLFLLNSYSASATEPSGPLSAGAVLVGVQDSAQGRSALVRIDLLANAADSEATVFLLEADRTTPRGPAVGRATLPKGQTRSLLVHAEVQPGHETHLFYRVKARGLDGSFSETNVYLRVPPDDSSECVTVGDYLQCQGVPAAQVQP